MNADATKNSRKENWKRIEQKMKATTNLNEMLIASGNQWKQLQQQQIRCVNKVLCAIAGSSNVNHNTNLNVTLNFGKTIDTFTHSNRLYN